MSFDGRPSSSRGSPFSVLRHGFRSPDVNGPPTNSVLLTFLCARQRLPIMAEQPGGGATDKFAARPDRCATFDHSCTSESCSQRPGGSVARESGNGVELPDPIKNCAPFMHDLRFTHGHPFGHIAPMKHVQSLTQVGIRSLRESEESVGGPQRDGNRVVIMSGFRRLKPAGIAKLVPANAACMSPSTWTFWIFRSYPAACRPNPTA